MSSTTLFSCDVSACLHTNNVAFFTCFLIIKKTNFYTQRFELKSWYIVLRKPIRYKPPFIDNFYVEEKYSISEGIVKFYWKCSKCKIAHESGSLEIAKAKAEHHESMMHKAKPVATFGWSTEKSQYTKVLG